MNANRNFDYVADVLDEISLEGLDGTCHRSALDFFLRSWKMLEIWNDRL